MHRWQGRAAAAVMTRMCYCPWELWCRRSLLLSTNENAAVVASARRWSAMELTIVAAIIHEGIPFLRISWFKEAAASAADLLGLRIDLFVSPIFLDLSPPFSLI